MQPIYTTDKASDFVNKLNQNFSEASGSSGGSTSLSLKMYGGQYNTSGADAGKPVFSSAISDTSTYLKYFHSGLLKVAAGTTIECTLDSGESLTVLGYDNTFAFVGASSSAVPSGASYARLMLNKSSGFTGPRILECSFSSQVKPIKDAHAVETMCKFIFGVDVESDIPEAPANLGDYNGENGSRYYDLGMVYLPTNYDPEGEPVPLVIYCHGTTAFSWIDNQTDSPKIAWDSFHKFLCYNGYAVADCCGVTSKYGPITNTSDPDYNADHRGMGNPLLVNSIIQLYYFLTERYNFSQDGVYLIGRSTGGKTAFLLPHIAPFKVRAVAGLAPGISVLNSFRHCNAGEANFVLRRYGYRGAKIPGNFGIPSGTNNVITTKAQEDEANKVLGVIDRFVGWDAFFAGSNIDITSEAGKNMIMGMWKKEYTPNNGYDGRADYASMWSVIDASAKHIDTPSKIWISASDTQTPLWQVLMYQKLVRNGGGICYVRLLPNLGSGANGHGTHYSMDDHPNAPRMNYVTKYKGTINMTVGYAEMVDWFNQW